MRTALRRPGIAIFFALLTAVGVWGIGRTLDSELLPEVRQGEFTIEIQAPVGTPLQETQRMMSQVEQTLLDNLDGIQSLLVTYGYDITNLNRSDEGEHSARFKVLIEPSLNAREAEEPIADRLRRAVEQIPDVEFRLTRPVLFSSKAPIALEIHGDDLVELKRKSDQAVALLEKLPEVTDVEPTLRAGAPEIQVIYDRDKIAIYGLNLQQVANQVRDLVKGNEPTKFNLKDRRIPIVVRLDEKDRERAEDIGRLTVNPGQERPIPLSSVASIELGKGPSEIRRVDGRRVAIIEANIGAGSLGAAVKAIERTMNDDMEWQPGYTFYLTGPNEDWENSRGSLFLALGLSVFLVYVIMAAQFESLTQPLIIMLTIPLAFFGAVIGLKICGISISIVVFLGMIMLAGIVVNNAIVLIDYINTLRKRGVERVDAIIQSGTVRLRPILMSTGTTVLGLAPMAMGLGDGAEIRTPMAITVIFGLIFSTALTLVIIPSIYCVVDIFMESLKNRFLPQEITESESGTAGSAQPDPSSVV
jgi:HAE1 family hydrophobic/amphiphilic exporter-1